MFHDTMVAELDSDEQPSHRRLLEDIDGERGTSHYVPLD